MKNDKLKEMSKGHTKYYLKDGTLVVGTTTATGQLAKPFLITWANRLGLEGVDSTKYTDNAAKIGTLIHHLVECHIKKEEPKLNEYSQDELYYAYIGLNKFLKWESENKIEYIAVEKQLVSEQYRFGGTMDLYAKVNGVLSICDFKSGSGIYKEHFLQVGGAYGQLADENEMPYEQVIILNIGRNEKESFKQETITKETAKKYFPIFKALLDIYYAKKELAWE